MGSIVIFVFAVLMVAVWGIAVPEALSVFSVRMPDRSAFARSAPLLSLLIFSAKVSVMFAPAFVTVAPFAGRNDGGSGAAAAPTVKVALVALPWLPCASQWSAETATYTSPSGRSDAGLIVTIIFVASMVAL